MTIEEQVLEKLRALPPEKQKEVLDFVHSLKEKNGAPKPRRSLLGFQPLAISGEDLSATVLNDRR